MPWMGDTMGKLDMDVRAVPHSRDEGKHKGVGIEDWVRIMRTVSMNGWGGNEIEKKPN